MRTKTKLNILSLAEWDYAGVGFLLSKAVNEFTDSASRAVRWTTSYIKYPHDLLQPNANKLRALWKQADVIHIHDAFNHLPKGLPARPTIVTWHGSKYRRAPKQHNDMAKKRYWLPTVSTLDLTMLGNALWMPDVRFPYTEMLSKHKQFTVCHAPTSRPGKSTETVIMACRRAGVALELIERLEWHECLRLKARCHVLVDQFHLGYGCNAIEAWAMGMPVIGDADKPIKVRMSKEFAFPCLSVADDIDRLAALLTQLKKNKATLDTFTELGQQHYARYHSPQATAERAIDYYHKAIELFYQRKPSETMVEVAQKTVATLPGREGMIRLRYIGGNVGTEPHRGEITNTVYKVSALKPIFYCDAGDAAKFLELGRTNKRGTKKPLFERV